MEAPTNSKNVAIGALSTTAAILFVGLVLIQTRPQPTQADGMTIVAGDYVLTVGELNRLDEELLYVIDAPAQRLISYRLDIGRKQIELVQGIDLEEMRRQTGDAGNSNPVPTKPATPPKP